MKGLKGVLLGLAGSAALAATVTLAAGEKIVGGPFAVGVTQKSATMVWIVQSDELMLRPAAGGATLTSPSLRVEKTTLTDCSRTRATNTTSSKEQTGARDLSRRRPLPARHRIVS